MAPLNSNTFVPDLSINRQENQFQDQLAALLDPQNSIMPGQLNFSNPYVEQQQNPPQKTLQTQHKSLTPTSPVISFHL